MKLLLSFLLSALIFVQPLNVQAEEKHYDPQHTVLALNMAVVSIHRILSTNDRAILDTEYRNIINNLKYGNIESDAEIIALFEELIAAIRSKTFSSEARRKLQANYDEWAKRNLSQSVLSLSGIIQGTLSESAFDASKSAVEKTIDKGLTVGLSAGLTTLASGFTPAAIVTVAGSLAGACISEYYAHQNAKLDAEFRRELTRDILRIDKEEHDTYTALQSRLLNSSWHLLRKYKLPDEYRIVQTGIDDFLKAVNESDSAKRRAMLIALEDEFRVYPPYWVYRAKSAENAKEASECFDEFNNVWRSVLRNDLWKAEAEKFRVIEAINAGKRNDAMTHLDMFCANIQRSDWTENIFAGVTYYMLGEREKGKSRVELNINFGAENEISKAILTQMKEGRLDFVKLPEDLRKNSGLSSMSIGTLKFLAETGDIGASFTLGKIYEDGGISFGLTKLYEEGKITSKDYVIAFELCGTKDGSKNKSDNVTAEISDDGRTAKFTFGKTEYTVYRITARDYAEALKWYKKAAYEGSRIAQDAIAHLYFNGGFNISQSYYDSYIWCCVSEMTERYIQNIVRKGSIIAMGATPIAVHVLGGIATLAGASAILPIILPVVGVSYLVADFVADRSIKEEIEGVGLFNLAKLSEEEMNRAKEDARKIMAEIERNIKQKQKQQQ